MKASVIVGGDICPTPRDSALFASGDGNALFGDLTGDFGEADLCVANLECPIVTAPTPIPKSGNNLGAPPGTERTIRSSGIHAVSLANNHILDHGSEGIRSTLEACDSVGLGTFGAGCNLAAASRLFIYEAGSLRIGCLALAEREFNIATAQTPGAAPIGAMEFVRAVRAHSGAYDRLIVMLHAGKEHIPFPPPRLRDLCRFMVEEGASAVFCQHSHTPGWFEEYLGGLIVYGQGNLLFDPWPDPRPWLYEGFLVRLMFDRDSMTYALIPHEQHGDRLGVRRMNECAANALVSRLRSESEVLMDPGALERRWSDYCRERSRLYFSVLRGHGRVARKLNAWTGYARFCYSRTELLDLYNAIHCESLRETLESALASEVERATGWAGG